MRAFVLSLFLVFGLFAITPPAAADDGYRAKHRYIYYPSYPIYYAPARRHWFWWHDGRWLSGAFLPWRLRSHLHDGVSLYYDSPYPYHYHHHTIRRYPRHNPHYTQRPYDYHYNSRPWYWDWNDRNHHGRDRDRHHGGSHWDRDRHDGRHHGRDHDRGRDHDGRRGRGRDGRRDGRG